ncbi:MAG: XdhC family protein, partial [Oscillospiraceae bacterium]
RCEALAKKSLEEKKNSTKAFKLDRGDVENLGMICGGDVTVFFKYISFEDKAILALCDKIIEAYEKDSDIWLIADVTDSINATFGCYSKENGFFGISPLCDNEKLLAKRSVLVTEGDKSYYSEPIFSSGNVIIFGGGHIAQELVPLLSHLEFHCIIMDDRAEFANAELFPKADKIICGSFENIFDHLNVEKNDYAVVLTRGHASDYIVEKQLHSTKAGYIGVIGSRKKMVTVFEKLRSEGVSDEALKKV